MMILFNNQTGEYRYYIPYFNSRILTYPFAVSNRNSICFLMNKILRTDNIEQVRAVRPSTAWTLAFITNVQYNIFLTDFPLGAIANLSNYIIPNRYLKNMIIYCRKNHIKTICVFFRCLKLHFNNHQKAKDKFRTWLKYNNRTMHESQFPGIMFEDITEIEKCFSVKVLICNLNSNSTVSCVYETMSQNSSKMYHNVYHNHYSYITNFPKFTKKFQCEKCSEIFKKIRHLERHTFLCYERTKYIFPGGFS